MPRSTGGSPQSKRSNMQQANNERIAQWIKVEHYRLHCVEEWPDSPYKQAVLAGTRSILERLKASLAPIAPEQCIVCASRRTDVAVLPFSVIQKAPAITRLAA